MNKLMEEHRKRFGDFEVIDFVDEGEIARLRARTDVAAPLTLNWTWEYGSEVEELRNLYEKGKVNQWNAESDLDWSTPVSKDDWVIAPDASILANMVKLMGGDEKTQKAAAFDELHYILSQLLHGEQAALQLCGQLTNACSKMDEKWYAASQVTDEARHIEALAKFMQRKLGTIYPIGATLKLLLDELLVAPDARTKTLGMQCLFEGVTCGRLGGFGDRILQVHDHHIGTTRQGLADSLRARRRDEQGGARIGGKRVGAGGHGAPRCCAASRAAGS